MENLDESKPRVGRNMGNMGKGRPKGTPNKATKALKEMILGALSDVGGQSYLARQAEENPTAFLTLVGKVLPHELKADLEGSGNMTVSIQWQE